MTLREFFEENPVCAVAFSGGVDSAVLLSAANSTTLELQLLEMVIAVSCVCV